MHLLVLLLAGCWTPETNGLPEGAVPFEPEVEAPEGWEVTEITLATPLPCPDGENPPIYVVAPALEEGGAPPTMPVAVVFPSGSFDYIFGGSAENPLGGTSFATPTRLTRAYGIEQAYATLGMFPEPDPTETHDGSLIAALADAGVASVVPTNCWGDYWHNQQPQADNDFTQDFFFRNGRTTAYWTSRLVTDAAFRSGFQVELPFTPDTTQLFLIGLGEGGRAVGEVLQIDADDVAGPDIQPLGILVDSHVEDLSSYESDLALYARHLAGLERIFPNGKIDVGSIDSVPQLPERVAWLYSDVDSTLPAGSQDRILARLQRRTLPTWIYQASLPHHILVNEDKDRAAEAVQFLLTGSTPDTPADTSTP